MEGIEKYCRHTFIPGDELYAGELDRALEEIESAPAPIEQIPRGGSEIAARHIHILHGKDLCQLCERNILLFDDSIVELYTYFTILSTCYCYIRHTIDLVETRR